MPEWFERLFDHKELDHYQFGRGINALVNPDEPTLFIASSEAFDQEKTFEAYRSFLTSLQNFKAEMPTGNIVFTEDSVTLRFELIQGSAKIFGVVTKKSLEADCIIADATKIDVAVKRRLLERDYQLTYSRFYALEGKVRLKIRLDNMTMTPQKVFFPLREIALNADYEKEYIASEFDENALLDTDHIIEMPTEEKALKYDYMQQWIAEYEERLKRLPSDDNVGMVAFTYLTLLLQIDYLIVPKKQIGQKILQHITDYFSDNSRSVERKNAELQAYVVTLKAIDFDTFSGQLYNSLLTFSPMERATHEEIVIFIDESLGKIRWYKNNRYNQIIMTLYHYIALYLLYNYGLHPSLRTLLHLLVEVQYADYFKSLGFKPLYEPSSKKFEKRQILNRIEKAITPYQAQYKQLKPFGERLDLSSMEQFSHDFYLQLKHLDYTEA